MNPIFTDIIGEDVRIIRSKDPTILNFRGRVINESKNMLVVRGVREIKIPKSIVHIEIGGHVYDMSKLRYRPEDKIRKMRRKGRI